VTTGGTSLPDMRTTDSDSRSRGGTLRRGSVHRAFLRARAPFAEHVGLSHPRCLCARPHKQRRAKRREVKLPIRTSGDSCARGSFAPRCAHCLLVRPVHGLGEEPVLPSHRFDECEVERRGGHDGSEATQDHRLDDRCGRPEVRERSATTESGAASGQRMPFPDYVSTQGPVPIPWTPMDPVVFSLLRRAALVDPQRPCGCAWGDASRMVGDCLTTLPLG
jgi:hypothetical protein